MAKLGDQVCDSITGFKGIVTARAEYLNGCVRVEIEAPVDDNGNRRDSAWVDEQRVDALSLAKTGGPAGEPPRRNPPSA